MKKYRAKYLKVQTVAKDLDYHPRTIYRWIDEKKIPAININGTMRIPADWLYDFVENLKNEAIDALLTNSGQKKSDK